MASKMRAFVTGISGQDGSYLVELLLEKGYEVHGFARRGSVFHADVAHHVGDLTDPAILRQALTDSKPDEIYNLGGMSHVQASFREPEHTFRATAAPILTILEYARSERPTARIYQASSSEMFGDAPAPQNENSPFRPLSPYAIAKVAAHHTVELYRRAHGIFAVGGILFNHECITGDMPVVIRKRGVIDILPIEEVVPHRENPAVSQHKKYTTEPSEPVEVWDRDGWTRVMCMTATWADAREVVRLHARSSLITATPEHVVFVGGDGQPREARSVSPGMSMTLGSVPPVPSLTTLTADEAWLLGALVADGYVEKDGAHVRFTKNDDQLRERVSSLWTRVTGGWSAERLGVSGYSDNAVKRIDLYGAEFHYKKWLRQELYTERGMKRVPKRVLNADASVQLAFLRGYNACDGLKEGHGSHEFKSWKTNSPTLAAALWWMAQTVLKQRTILCVEDRDDFTYFTVNLNTPDELNLSLRGAHMRRPLEEVLTTSRRSYTGWLFDLATESETFHAGIGQGWIHNSPRRPASFVTRKITSGVARIFAGAADELVLGNLDAKRDWGFAGDYVVAMWLMLQQEVPKDYVIASGNAFSVRDFVGAAFDHANAMTGRSLQWEMFVKTDERFQRPADVPHLLGNATRACRELGWKPEVTWDELVRRMVRFDLELHGVELCEARYERDRGRADLESATDG